MESGADVLELDVHLTKDNELVVIHDPTLERTTNGRGKIKEKTLSEIKTCDAGCKFSENENGKIHFPLSPTVLKVPALTEVFAEFPKMKFNIDIKQHDKKACEALLKKIREFNLSEKVLVASDHYKTICYFRKISNREIATGASIREVGYFLVLLKMGISSEFYFEGDALQIPESYWGVRFLNEDFISKAHEINLPVHVWTVNIKEDMIRLLKWGVDGIMTNYPSLLCETISDLK